MNLLVLALAIISSLVSLQASVSPKDALRHKDPMTMHCGMLETDCATGSCEQCCDAFLKHCKKPKVTIRILPRRTYKRRSIPKRFEDMKTIRRINRHVTGETANQELARTVILANGQRATFHSNGDIKYIKLAKQQINRWQEKQGNTKRRHDVNSPYFGSDILLTPHQARGLLRRARYNAFRRRGHGRHRSTANVLPRKLVKNWPQTVYYTFDKSADSDPLTKRITRAAANYWSENTCLNMLEGNPPSCGKNLTCKDNQLVVTRNGGCASNLGMVGGPQALHLGGGCESFGIACREMGHSFGLAGSKKCADYGYDSALAPMLGGRAVYPSFCDLWQVNNEYCAGQCPGKNPCLNGGYLHPRSCNRCVCPPSFTGSHCQTPCPSLQCDPQCNVTRPCPVPKPYQGCRVSSWTSWSSCSVSCGFGILSRSRYPLTNSQDCHSFHLTESRSCNIPCNTSKPEDCVLSNWTPWSDCSETCGHCRVYRSRQVISQATPGGRTCAEFCTEDTKQVKKRCDNEIIGPPVNEDCKVSQWSDWSECQVTCDVCATTRRRSVLKREVNGGVPCDQLKMHEASQIMLDDCFPPPRDCSMETWSEWSGCSKTCNGICVQTRKRTVMEEAENGGIPCDEFPIRSETRNFPLPGCPVDCDLSEWSVWSSCTQMCGLCQQNRFRDVLRYEQYGGADCGKFELEQYQTTDVGPCPVITNCVMDSWSEWSECKVTCGSCMSQRNRMVEVEAMNGGRECSTYGTREVKMVELLPCPVDCYMSDWSPWSTCTETCGKCVRRRYRHVSNYEEHGGRKCAEMETEQSRVEELKKCPIVSDCELTPWSEWASCEVTCGPCYTRRHREVMESELNGGRPCGKYDLYENKNVEQISCDIPQDCLLSMWSPWSSCLKTCGDICRIVRNRTIVAEGKNGGQECSKFSVQEFKSQRLPACQKPRDAVFTDWSEWTSCDVTCGLCTIQRTRDVVTEGQYGGMTSAESELMQTKVEDKGSCKVDCKLADWSEWTSCPNPCGECHVYRRRDILQQESGGGFSCGDFCRSGSKSVDQQACPADPLGSFTQRWYF